MVKATPLPMAVAAPSPLRGVMPSKAAPPDYIANFGDFGGADDDRPYMERGTGEVSTDYVLFGDSSLKATGAASQASTPIRVSLRKFQGGNATADFSNHSFRIAYYVEKRYDLGSLSIYYFPDDAADWNDCYVITELPLTEGRWHVIEWTTSQMRFYDDSTIMAMNAVGSIWLIATGTSGATDLPIIHFNMLEARPNVRTKAGLIFHVDDAIANAVAPIQQAARAGVKTTIAVPYEKLGTVTNPGGGDSEVTYMTAAQLDSLVATGMVRLAPHRGAYPASESIPSQIAYLKQISRDLTHVNFDDDGRRWAPPTQFILPAGTQGPAGNTHDTPDDFALMLRYFAHIRGTSPFWSGCPSDLGTDLLNRGSMPPEPVDTRWSWCVLLYSAMLGAAGSSDAGKYLTDDGILARCVADATINVVYLHGVGSAGGSNGLNNVTAAEFATILAAWKTLILAGTLEPLWTEDLYA